jgi:hypothetical protein
MPPKGHESASKYQEGTVQLPIAATLIFNDILGLVGRMKIKKHTNR